LNATPVYKDMHLNKDSLMLLKTIKGLTFQFDGEKEYEMSLVDAMDKLYRMFQTREMSNTQFRDKFNNLIDIIEHYGGSVGVHRKVTEDLLAENTGDVYYNMNWRSTYTDTQIQEAIEKGKEKILARMFLARADKNRYGQMMAKLQNDYVTGRHDVYPNNRVAAFALINNWNHAYEKGIYVTTGNMNGASFLQDNIGITCWGCGKEGVTLAECKNESCLKKYKARQERKGMMSESSLEKGQQLFNAKMDMNVFDNTDYRVKDEIIYDEYCGYDVGNEFHQKQGDRIDQ
jgi:hypothetical protein